MALVKHVFSEAKVGIQNTKDTLMVGRTSYCLGCSQPFPGVNGIRAPKVNHDALPPSEGLVPNTSSFRGGVSRKSLRPVQSLRSVYRPKSAIITGKFSSPLVARVRGRNNSR